MENENTYSKKSYFEGIRDIGQAESILNQYRRDNPDAIVEIEDLANTLLEALFENEEELFGDADDFHNFSVSISKILQDNQKATKVVKAGLKIHPMNTDLLADGLKYGYNCGEKESCKQWYQTLQFIDKSRWTWRAFSFSKDFLVDEWTSNKECAYTVEDILGLVKDYQAYIPDEEDAWQCEYEVYNAINKKDKGIQALEEAIARFKFCPRCWLRYADIMMDAGEYEKAEPVIRKMCRNPKSGESINASYMYFLDGQCKLTKLQNSEYYEAFEDGDIDDDIQAKVERSVWNIYKAFRKALSASGLRENVKSQISEYTTQLEADTGIEFPDEWR